MKRKLFISSLVILLLLSGFLRDFVMMNINHVLKHLTSHVPNFSTPLFYPLEDWTVAQIMVLKWGLTVFFFFYFWAISFTFMINYFPKHRPAGRSVTIVYIALIAISGLLYAGAMVLDIDKTIYPVVRTLMGISHSFIPSMLIFLYLKYLPEK